LNEEQIAKNNVLSYISKGIGVLHEIKNSNLKIWALNKEEIKQTVKK
jgi:hypothetical protein